MIISTKEFQSVHMPTNYLCYRDHQGASGNLEHDKLLTTLLELQVKYNYTTNNILIVVHDIRIKHCISSKCSFICVINVRHSTD